MSGVEMKNQLVGEAMVASEPPSEKPDSECVCGTGVGFMQEDGTVCCCLSCRVYPIRLPEVVFLGIICFIAVMQLYALPFSFLFVFITVYLRTLAGNIAVLLTIYMALTVVYVLARSGWGRFRTIAAVVAAACWVLCLASVLVLWPEARRLEDAISAEFGASDPPNPTPTALSFADWLSGGSTLWGPYESQTGGFQVETHTFLTGVRRKPGWNPSPAEACGRAFLDELALDVYSPRRVDGQLAPIIFHIHGGAWIVGDKDAIPGNSAYFLDRGYALISPQYSFWCDGFSIHEMLAQLTVALDYVRANAKGWGFNPDRIFLTGISAGGHLALMMAYTLNSTECGDWKTCGIKGVFNVYGPTDYPFTYAPVNNVSTLTGTEDEAKHKEAFPVHHVTSDVPPTMSFHGTWDSICPFSLGAILHERLRDVGVKQLLIPAATFEHGAETGFYAGGGQMHRFAFERFVSLRAWDEE